MFLAGGSASPQWSRRDRIAANVDRARPVVNVGGARQTLRDQLEDRRQVEEADPVAGLPTGPKGRARRWPTRSPLPLDIAEVRSLPSLPHDAGDPCPWLRLPVVATGKSAARGNEDGCGGESDLGHFHISGFFNVSVHQVACVERNSRRSDHPKPAAFSSIHSSDHPSRPTTMFAASRRSVTAITA